jgi:glutathione S-transferase
MAQRNRVSRRVALTGLAVTGAFVAAGVVAFRKELLMSSLAPFPFRTITSHPLCPFLQRVVLTAIVKGYVRGKDFAPRYHALGEAPEWFLAISPQRRDPAFHLATGDGVLFDARVAAALVDEASGPTLAAGDVVVRAKERELVGHAQIVLDALRSVFTAKDDVALNDAELRLFDALLPIEPQLKARGSRYNGACWSQVDCAFAPVFSLMFFHARLRSARVWSELPNVKRWGLALSDDPLVQASKCERYGEEFERFFARMGSRFPEVADARH